MKDDVIAQLSEWIWPISSGGVEYDSRTKSFFKEHSIDQDVLHSCIEDSIYEGNDADYPDEYIDWHEVSILYEQIMDEKAKGASLPTNDQRRGRTEEPTMNAIPDFAPLIVIALLMYVPAIVWLVNSPAASSSKGVAILFLIVLPPVGYVYAACLACAKPPMPTHRPRIVTAPPRVRP